MKNHSYNKISISPFVISVTLLITVATALAQKPSATIAESPQEQQVRDFVAAFNTRNIDRMLEAADENIQWLSVDGPKIGIETEGKKALRQSMESYFRSCPSCKSDLEWMQKAGSRVTALERATWTGKSGLKSQRGLSIYEFRDGKIFRVYYFPADVDGPNTTGK